MSPIAAIPLATLLLAQGPSDAPMMAGAKLESVWDFVIKGGPTMVVIILVSLIAMAVVVERLVVLRRRAVVPPAFLEGLAPFWSDRDKALAYCRTSASPIARVLEAVLLRRDEGVQAIEKAVEDSGRREIVRLRHRMRLLGALPQISTMLGLLGTIFGMIKTFQAVAASGQALGKTELLAKGIFEAWTCTAAGLLVAIPILVTYHILMGRIDARIVELDRAAEEWAARERALARGQSRPAPAIAAVAPARAPHLTAPDPSPVPIGAT